MRFRAGQRLRRTGEFRAVREEGRRIDCGAFLLAWRLRPPVGEKETPAPARPARVGVVASRAAVGNAVHRNRAKRRLRELFRRHQALIPVGVELVLTARSSLLRVDLAEASRRFTEACARISVPHHA